MSFRITGLPAETFAGLFSLSDQELAARGAVRRVADGKPGYPCRVSLTMRWRIEPLASGCTVRLGASYRLNHAAILRRHHWDERLRLNFRNQFTFLAVNLSRMQGESQCGAERGVKRDFQQV